MPMIPRNLMVTVRLLIEVIRDLAPIVLVILFFQEIVLQQPIPNLEDMFIGLALFIRGLKIEFFPVGEAMTTTFLCTLL